MKKYEKHPIEKFVDGMWDVVREESDIKYRKNKPQFEIGDMVILKLSSASSLYDGVQFNRLQYKELHEKNIKGKITELKEYKNHYLWGEYASIKWNNGKETNCIHTSWLQKYENISS